ncbi:hypothetical protein IEE94_00080 [Yimella sp. cx-573]|nr:hypothetical protein [Yimella sp. cx-573]
MKAWLVVSLLVITIGWTVWSQARLQHHVLGFLVRRADGSARRGTVATHLLQGTAALLAVSALVAAVVVEMNFNAVWLRIPLAALVLIAYVPFAATLGRTKLRKIRRPVQERMQQLGAPSEVADAIARAGRPWSLFGTLVMLAAALVLSWHHMRT